MKNLKLHIIVFIFFLGFFIGINISVLKSQENSAFKYIEQFHFVYNIINSEYVEKVSPKQLLEGATSGLLRSLGDPYSKYLSEEMYSQFKKNVTGEYVGVGIEVSQRDEVLTIIAPLNNSPAQKAGILPGDIIIQINDTPVKKDNFSTITSEIGGPKGSKVKLLIKRTGFIEPIEFELKRNIVKVNSIESGIIKETNIGYIKISHFYSQTPNEMKQALDIFKKSQINSIIIDLRGNPGGDMNSAIKLSDIFLEKNKVIVTTKGRDSTKEVKKYLSQQDPIFHGKILILVNEGSASSSEIFAAALRDNDRAKLLGTKTFGKGLVQNVIEIEKDKTAFTLTVFKYYTPSGKMIHKKGINPDYIVKSQLFQENDTANINKILKDRLIQEFAKNNSKYDNETINKFVTFLASKDLKINRHTAAYLLKSEFNRLKPNKLYDLEFDDQLIKAIEKINGK